MLRLPRGTALLELLLTTIFNKGNNSLPISLVTRGLVIKGFEIDGHENWLINLLNSLDSSSGL